MSKQAYLLSLLLCCCIIGCSDDAATTSSKVSDEDMSIDDMMDMDDLSSPDLMDMPDIKNWDMAPPGDMFEDVSKDMLGDMPQDMPQVCLSDEHVVNHQCMPCPGGTTNLAGDDPTGPDTACEDICEVRFGKRCDGLRQVYLKASNTGSYDRFGYSVAADGKTLVVGAQLERSGISDDQNDDSTPGGGAAYVFEKQANGVWVQQAYLKATSPKKGDRFGNSVAISGDTIAIGVRDESSDAVGVNGTSSTKVKRNSGAVYIFKRSSGRWTQQAYIKSSNADEGDFFGVTIALDGDILAVGANGEDGASTGVNGDLSNNSVGNNGAVYVFERVGETWTQSAYLKPAHANKGNEFGEALSVSGQTLVVGMYTSKPDNMGGSVYVFTKVGGLWQQEAILKASNLAVGGNFGYSVSLDGERLAVGAIGEDSAAVGIDGDQSDTSASNSGAVYLFERQAATWTQKAYIKASNTDASDQFGFHVALKDRVLLVSAPYESSNATNINGDQRNNDASRSGAVYLFARVGDTWSQRAYIKASNTDKDDAFGWSVALTDDALIISAPAESSDAKGVGGHESNNNMPGSGAVYVFE